MVSARQITKVSCARTILRLWRVHSFVPERNRQLIGNVDSHAHIA